MVEPVKEEEFGAWTPAEACAAASITVVTPTITIPQYDAVTAEFDRLVPTIATTVNS